MPEYTSENIPAEWVGKPATVQYKAITYETGEAWAVGFVDGVIEDKNDLGLFIRQQRDQIRPDAPANVMLIAYDALLTVDVADR